MIIMNKHKPRGYWTKERCIEDARKYELKINWNISSISAYNSAYKNGWLYECCLHMKKRKPKGYWTLKKCKEDASKYDLKENWSISSGGAFNSARKNGWLHECCLHMNNQKPRGYWTKEKCIEDARKYKLRKNWMTLSVSAYNSAFKNGWIHECHSHMEEIIKPSGYWTKERCIEDAKKHKTKKSWRDSFGGANNSAVKNGWLDECCSHMEEIIKPNGYWTKERCIEDSVKYTSERKWRKISGGAYNSALKNGWKNECVSHMEETSNVLMIKHKPKGYWTKEKCIEDALRFSSIVEWQTISPGTYTKSREKGWLDECRSHMKPYSNPSKRVIYVIIFPNKYVYIGLTKNIKKRFAAHLTSVSRSICKHMTKFNLKQEDLELKILTDLLNEKEASEKEGYFKEKFEKEGYITLNIKKTGNLGGRLLKWTKEKCIEDARKYESRSKWDSSSRSAYNSAWNNGWLDECCSHMIPKETIKM